MGIKGLGTLIKPCKKTVQLSNFKNCKIAIDISIFMYAYLRQPRKNALLQGFYNQIQLFKKHNITPVYVFDGAPPSTKKVIKERVKIRKTSEAKLNSKHKQFKEEFARIQRSVSKISGKRMFTTTTKSGQSDVKIDEADLPMDDTLQHSDLQQSDLQQSDLQQSDLQQSDLQQSDLKQSDLQQSDLNNTDEIEITKMSVKDSISAKINIAEIEEDLQNVNNETDKIKIQLAIGEMKELKSQQNDLVKNYVNTRYPNSTDRRNLRQLFQLTQIPFILAPYESDPLCAKLNQLNLVSACLSTDHDLLTFGCKTLITNFKTDNDEIQLQNIDTILQKLELTFEQFVELCILCGCDYCGKIKGIGPKTALKFLKKIGTLEKTIDVIRSDKKLSVKHPIENDFCENSKLCKKIFGYEHNCFSFDDEILTETFEEVISHAQKSDFDREKLDIFLKEHDIKAKPEKKSGDGEIFNYFSIKEDRE
jgi:5'-3' exonuclease